MPLQYYLSGQHKNQPHRRLNAVIFKVLVLVGSSVFTIYIALLRSFSQPALSKQGAGKSLTKTASELNDRGIVVVIFCPLQDYIGEMHPSKQDKRRNSEFGPNPLLLASPRSKSFHIENVPSRNPLLHDCTVHN